MFVWIWKNSTNSLFEFGKTVQIFFLGKKKKSTCFWMYLYVCRFNMYEIHILYLNCVYWDGRTDSFFCRFSFNPYSIATCLARSTAVFNNIIILLALYQMLKGQLVPNLHIHLKLNNFPPSLCFSLCNFLIVIVPVVTMLSLHFLPFCFRKFILISSFRCAGSLHFYVSHHSLCACGCSLFPGL